MPGLPWMAETRRTIRLVTGAMVITMLPFMSQARAGEDKVCRSAVSNRPAQAGPIYLHRVVMRYELGEGPRSYWLFEPAEPKPERAPVVVFFHGWFAVNPAFYGAWIDHLVRSGRTVVFPRYQNDVDTLPREFLPNAIAATRDALDRIPASTLLLVAVGEDDLLVGDLRGRQIFAQAGAIPRSRKRFLLFRSDRHGFPPLIAEHTAPTGVNRRLDTGEGVFRVFQMSLGDVNALDRAGFWRIADVAVETAFAGSTFDEAIRDEERFTHLGFWSDGRKVNPPLISDNLSSIPRVNFPNGIRVIPWDGTVKVNEAARIETDVRIK